MKSVYSELKGEKNPIDSFKVEVLVTVGFVNILKIFEILRGRSDSRLQRQFMHRHTLIYIIITQSDTYYPPYKHLISLESIRLIVIHMFTLHSSPNRSYTQQLTLIPPTPYLSTQSDTYYPPLEHLISLESIRLIVIHMYTLHSSSNRSYTQQLTLIHPTPNLSTQSDAYYPTLKLPISLKSIRLIVIHMSTLQCCSNRSYTQQLPPHTPNTLPLNTIR